MGRKRTKGNRSASGRLKKATTADARQKRDHGNEIVQARRNLFDAMCIRAGKAADQVFDGIGQLWALDFLDGHHLDPELMRDTARQYGEIYWRRNADKAPTTGQIERADRAKNSLIDTAGDIRFERWLDTLPSLERRTLESVVVDHWFTDERAPFVCRLVGNELMKRGRIRFAEPEHPNDRYSLAALLRALFLLVDGALPMRNLRAA